MGTQRPFSDLLPDLIAFAPELVGEIVDGIRAAIPDYDRPEGSPYDKVICTAVKRNVLGFVEGLADPGRPLDRRNELCRELGAFEAMEGRPLAVLQSAYRIGAQLGWSRIRDLLAEREPSAAAVSALAEALFGYMDDAAELSREGYDRIKGEEHEKRDAARLLLLRDLVRRPCADRAALAARHPAADWTVPDRVTLVALPEGVPLVRPLLDPDLLLDLRAPEPYLLVPGPLNGSRRGMLEEALAGGRAAAGLTVPHYRAAHSLRWARRVLALVDEGILDDGALTSCEDHLVSAWLLADGPLMDEIARRRLSFLKRAGERRRQWLTDTLRSWLRTRGPAGRMSDDLGVHVQTVRYRMRVLEEFLEDTLTDPDTRFATEAALRFLWLRGRSRRPAEPQEAALGHGGGEEEDGPGEDLADAVGG